MADRPPSHLRATLQLLARGLRRRAGAVPDALSGPRRRPSAERAAIAIDPARLRRYRRLLGAREADEASRFLPPVYSSTWETALALELFAGEELPLPTGGLVHLESELVVLRPLRVDDRIRARVEVDRADPHPHGLRITLRCRNWNGAGQLCQENTLVLLARTGEGSARPDRPAEPPPAPAGEVGEAAWRPLDEWALPGDLGRRYARVSGDFNPIHLWGWTARLLGYDRPILHGYCTEAMIARALTERLWSGDPTALRRLRVAFRAPLALPARVQLQAAGDSAGRLRVVDPATADGKPFAEGEFLGAGGA